MDTASFGAIRSSGVTAPPRHSPNRRIRTRTRGHCCPPGRATGDLMQKISLNSRMYIAAVVVIGAAQLVNGLVHWKSAKPLELLALLFMTMIASRLKVKLPGINGSMSVNVPFLLIVAVRLSPGESLAIAALASLVQSIPAAKGRINFT